MGRVIFFFQNIAAQSYEEEKRREAEAEREKNIKATTVIPRR